MTRIQFAETTLVTSITTVFLSHPTLLLYHGDISAAPNWSLLPRISTILNPLLANLLLRAKGFQWQLIRVILLWHKSIFSIQSFPSFKLIAVLEQAALLRLTVIRTASILPFFALFR